MSTNHMMSEESLSEGIQLDGANQICDDDVLIDDHDIVTMTFLSMTMTLSL